MSKLYQTLLTTGLFILITQVSIQRIYADEHPQSSCRGWASGEQSTMNCITEILVSTNTILLSVAFIMALFIFVSALYKVMTSEGDPQQKKAGTDQLTAVSTGVLFILFSVAILRVIINSALNI